MIQEQLMKNMTRVQSLVICNSEGFEYYSKILEGNTITYEPILLSGFISAIGALGRQLFKADLATIYFDNNAANGNSPYNIVIVTKDFYQNEKRIHFVFLVNGIVDIKEIRKFCTEAYINAKEFFFREEKVRKKDLDDKIDKVVGAFFM
jgi:hypothetical protein